jgi:hypothetical protein
MKRRVFIKRFSLTCLGLAAAKSAYAKGHELFGKLFGPDELHAQGLMDVGPSEGEFDPEGAWEQTWRIWFPGRANPAPGFGYIKVQRSSGESTVSTQFDVDQSVFSGTSWLYQTTAHITARNDASGTPVEWEAATRVLKSSGRNGPAVLLSTVNLEGAPEGGGHFSSSFTVLDAVQRSADPLQRVRHPPGFFNALLGCAADVERPQQRTTRFDDERTVLDVQPNEVVNRGRVRGEKQRFRVHELLENHHCLVVGAVFAQASAHGRERGTRDGGENGLHAALEIEIVIDLLDGGRIREAIDGPQRSEPGLDLGRGGNPRRGLGCIFGLALCLCETARRERRKPKTRKTENKICFHDKAFQCCIQFSCLFNFLFAHHVLQSSYVQKSVFA